MPLPLAPIAGVALRYGAVALAAYAVTRKTRRATIRQTSEDALDAVDEGLGFARQGSRQQLNAEARWRRIIRLGAAGPGIEIDASALGRVRFRKV